MQGVVPSPEAQDADTLDIDAQDASEAVSPEHYDDVALARALVQAARTVEHVVDVSAGRYGVAATYGPGQRVTGIALRRTTHSGWASFAVEAHIVVATAAVTVHSAVPLAAPKTSRNRRQRQRATSAPGTPVLLRIAEETRHTLAATLRRLRPGETWTIDITIDELRDANARGATQVL